MENEIQNKIKTILEDTAIADIDKDIIETLERIEEEQNYDDKSVIETVNNIENYLSMKRKKRILEEDFRFMNNLAEKLREQETRLSDVDTTNCVLKFKITNINNETMSFLTREAAKDYMEKNCEDFGTSRYIEVSSENSLELRNVLDIIKRNF